MPKRNDLEHKALQYVMNTGFKGVLQSDLWRELGASSREGSRISIKLEEKGLIRREKSSAKEDGLTGFFRRECLLLSTRLQIAHA